MYRKLVKNIIESIKNNEHLSKNIVYKLTLTPDSIWIRPQDIPFGIGIKDFTDVDETITYIDTIDSLFSMNNSVEHKFIVDNKDFLDVKILSELRENPENFHYLSEKIETLDSDIIISVEIEKEKLKCYFMLRPLKNLILPGSKVNIFINPSQEIALLLAYPYEEDYVMVYSVGVIESEKNKLEVDDLYVEPRSIYLS